MRIDLVTSVVTHRHLISSYYDILILLKTCIYNKPFLTSLLKIFICTKEETVYITFHLADFCAYGHISM